MSGIRPEWMVAVGAAALVYVAFSLRLLLMTWWATAWTPLVARAVSRWVGTYDYSETEFLNADGAGEPWIGRRRDALSRLASLFRTRYTQSMQWGQVIRDGLSDLRFTDATRVPFPFAQIMRHRFPLCSVVTESRGPWLKNVDGHWTLDVSGSYGLNVAGFDAYKRWMEQGWARVRELGPVLGPVHPIVAENVERLKQISGLDEVSFHMSGTEAVMAAVRLARFNTRRRLIVCFSGAYHGWWDGVQSGLGSERALDDCLVLRDMCEASLAVIRERSRDIAAVLVNPVQSFHPNTPPPNDAVLLTSGARSAASSSDPYAVWLGRVRAVCTGADVPLIFDEVYTGFRLAPGGAQEYFGVKADMVVYGKTVAGGLPIGVVCGGRALMRRFDPSRPMRMAYVVGTFSAHPSVMGAMREFLEWVLQPESATRYVAMNRRCTAWMECTNTRLEAEALPVRVKNLGTIWTLVFTEPSRFNWLLQYYLRADGLTLSWVGTGRCLSSMDFTDEDYDTLEGIVIGAARAMKGDGWWLTAAEHPSRERHMRERLAKEFIGAVVPVPSSIKAFYDQVMKRKEDDHRASHNHPGNQFLHLVSSTVFIVCYGLIVTDVTTAMCLGLSALLVRQFGHAILEPPCHDAESLLLGFSTRAKTIVVCGYGAILLAVLAMAGPDRTWGAVIPPVALHWFRWTLLVVLSRVVYLTWRFDFRIAMIWFVKLVTDPMTDLMSYRPWRIQGA